MFDTFDLLLPRLVSIPGLRTRAREADEDRHVYLGEIELGRTMLARDAFTAVTAWTGAPGREDWTVVLLRDVANAAARDDEDWRALLQAIATVLEAHPVWRVTCESDCEQHPVDKLVLTPGALVALLDGYRASRFFPIAFCAEAVGANG